MAFSLALLAVQLAALGLLWRVANKMARDCNDARVALAKSYVFLRVYQDEPWEVGPDSAEPVAAEARAVLGPVADEIMEKVRAGRAGERP